MMFGFVLPMLRPMAVMGVPPGNVVTVLVFVLATAAMAVMGVPLGDKGITLAFAVTAAVAVATFVGGGVGVCNIIALLRESWV
jgi:hypothetical protein